MSDNVFADDWYDCLREHYMDVVRQQDHKTLSSLTTVMLEVGYSEADLREMQVMATAHVDDVGEDFVPDLHILEPTVHAGVEVAEVQEVPEAVQIVEEVLEDAQDDAPPTYEEALQEEAVPEGEEADDMPEDDPDSPQQLTLF